MVEALEIDEVFKDFDGSGVVNCWNHLCHREALPHQLIHPINKSLISQKRIHKDKLGIPSLTMREEIINNLSIAIQYHVIEIDLGANGNDFNPVLQFAPVEESDDVVDA